MKKQAGNVVEWLIIGVVLIGAVALIAWRYIEADKDQNDAERSAGTNQTVLQNGIGHVKGTTYSLVKWSVYIDVPEALKNETNDISTGYYKDDTSGADAYYFVSKELKAAEYTCPKSDSMEANGAFLVVQRSSNQPSQSGVNATKVGDYYYWVQKALQAACYKDDLMTKYFGPYVPAMQSTIRTQAES